MPPGDRGHGNKDTKSTFVDSGVREGGLGASVAVISVARLPECGSIPLPGGLRHAEFFRTPAIMRALSAFRIRQWYRDARLAQPEAGGDARAPRRRAKSWRTAESRSVR